ncbi:MAG: HD-GYP domain-containing protein [Pyrinomonadaceae bacterium]
MFDAPKAEKSLLIIDENPPTRKTLVDFFCSRYVCDEAVSVENSFSKIRARHYGVIICNAGFCGLQAAEIMECFRAQSPASIVILTGEKSSVEEVVEAFRAGAFDYVRQPFKLSEVDGAVKKAFEKYESRVQKNSYQIQLEEAAAKRAAQLDKAFEEIENSYRLTLKALVQALETRDFETHGHSERAVTFSLRLGYELGLDKNALRNLEFGALLHDIGKIGVPDAILQKPATLNENEWEKMKLHPLHGQRILRNIPFLSEAEQVVAQHHEKWDGTGYPGGLRGTEISLNARIFTVADAFDAMVSDRIYRRGRSFQAALAELQNCAGTQFDPAIVEAFKRIPKEDWEFLRERSLGERPKIISFQTVVAELVHSKQAFEMLH